MYIPPSFDERDIDKLYALMRENSFATLVTQADNIPFATHLPFVVDPEAGKQGVLRSHMARANPQWRHFQKQSEVLVIFQGPHAYISPSWYKTELMVPTWNYAVVHAYGYPRLLDDAELYTALDALVAQYEDTREAPWGLRSLPSEFADKLMRAIVGFEIEITRLEGKFKMSQNRSEDDQRGAIAGLLETGYPIDRQVADWMQAYLQMET